MRRSVARAREPLRGSGLDGEIPFDLLPADFGEEVALPAAEAGMVEGTCVGALSPLELVEVELSLKGGELGVCIWETNKRIRGGVG